MRVELNDLFQYSGYKVIENPFMVKPGEPKELKRSWRERLFTRPWRPWVRTKMVATYVPSDEVLQVSNHTFIMHPVLARQLREATKGTGQKTMFFTL